MGSRQLSLLYWSAMVPLGMLLIASSGPNWEKKNTEHCTVSLEDSLCFAKSRVVFILLILFKPVVFENRKLLLLCKKNSQ